MLQNNEPIDKILTYTSLTISQIEELRKDLENKKT
jgi:hypothetical protein